MDDTIEEQEEDGEEDEEEEDWSHNVHHMDQTLEYPQIQPDVEGAWIPADAQVADQSQFALNAVEGGAVDDGMEYEEEEDPQQPDMELCSPLAARDEDVQRTMRVYQFDLTASPSNHDSAMAEDEFESLGIRAEFQSEEELQCPEDDSAPIPAELENEYDNEMPSENDVPLRRGVEQNDNEQEDDEEAQEQEDELRADADDNEMEALPDNNEAAEPQQSQPMAYDQQVRKRRVKPKDAIFPRSEVFPRRMLRSSFRRRDKSVAPPSRANRSRRVAKPRPKAQQGQLKADMTWTTPVTIGGRVAKRRLVTKHMNIHFKATQAASKAVRPQNLARPLEVTDYFAQVSAHLISHRVALKAFLELRKQLDHLVGEAMAKTKDC
ncbi:hypothetical protein KR044_007569 [Drosophila immigrans]|nr:hypothetical protein KR044_007569 [Drosophila immigrans]